MTPIAAETAIREAGAVVILRGLTDADAVDRLTGALVEFGFPCLEVTLDSPGALDAIARLRRRLGDAATVGAGTVRSAADVGAARDAGAAFLVAPCFDPASVEAARSGGRLLLPGVLTPSEAQRAHDAGCPLLKLFPSAPLGPAYLRALRGPYADLAFVPTGGVDAGNAAAWLDAGAAALGVGGALTRHLGDASALEREARGLRAAIDDHRASV